MKADGIKTPPKILNRSITSQFVERPWQDQTLYHRLIFLFQKESLSLLEQLKNCAHNQDMDNMHDHAHKLMGNCAVVGAERTWTLVASVCRKSGAGEVITPNAISEIEKELTIFLHEVELYLEEIFPPKTAK